MSATLSMPLPSVPGADRLAEAATHVERDGDRVVLTRAGKAVAAVVPIEDLEALEAAEDARDAADATRLLAEWEAEGRPAGISHADLLARHGIDGTPDPA